MSSNKNHINEENFRRYLANEMTNAERNAFEKELQKNPFEAEAFEGFEAVSSSDITNDLNEIRENVQHKKRKNRMPYFAAAASILLLITAGVIWMQLSRENPVPEMTELKTEAEETVSSKQSAVGSLEKAEEESSQQSAVRSQKEENLQLQVTEGKKGDSQKSEVGSQEKDNASPHSQKIAKEAPKKMERTAENEKILFNEVEEEAEIAEVFNVVDDDLELEEEFVMSAAPKQSIPKPASTKQAKAKPNVIYETTSSRMPKAGAISTPNEKIIRGKVISADDKMPIAGVSIVEKGTDNGIITDTAGQFHLKLKNDSNPVVASFVGMETNEFKPKNDSDNLITLTSDNVALSEVVVASKKSSRINTDAQPVCGMNAYKKYLDENSILPAKYKHDKVIVKVLLKIGTNGEIISIENTNKADAEIFKLAQYIILNGPVWTPKISDGNPQEALQKLKIIFRKE